MIRLFHQDEHGYEAWRQGHPAGHVLNYFGGRDPSCNVLHLSGCWHLNRPEDEGSRTSVKKVCSESITWLAAEADRLRGGPAGWVFCGSCLTARRRASGPARPDPVVREPAPATGEFRFWKRRKVLAAVVVPPLLASWEVRHHPEQKRLQSYLDILERHLRPALVDDEESLYSAVEVVLPITEDLLTHHDLENYLTPIAERLRLPDLVLAVATKRHPRGPDDHSRVLLGSVSEAPTPAGSKYHARTDGSSSSRESQHRLRTGLIKAGARRLPGRPRP